MNTEVLLAEAGAARSAERVETLDDDDLHALCEATHAAILDGGGFGWVNPPGRQSLETYYRGVLQVPERSLFLARVEGAVVGCAQLVRPPRNNEAQAFAATLMHAFVAPYARGHGIARLLTLTVEEAARSLGYTRWGLHPAYARVGGKTIRGFYYYKQLQVRAGGKRTEAADDADALSGD